MFGRHPLAPSVESLDRMGDADALRLAIIAELDAINFYLQVARRTRNPRVRRVFEDVAREEKTHAGEFLEVLLDIDPEQAEELARGRREVRELLGEYRARAQAVEQGSEERRRRVEQELMELCKIWQMIRSGKISSLEELKRYNEGVYRMAVNYVLDLARAFLPGVQSIEDLPPPARRVMARNALRMVANFLAGFYGCPEVMAGRRGAALDAETYMRIVLDAAAGLSVHEISRLRGVPASVVARVLEGWR